MTVNDLHVLEEVKKSIVLVRKKTELDKCTNNDYAGLLGESMVHIKYKKDCICFRDLGSQLFKVGL